MVPATLLAFMDALIPESGSGKEEGSKKGVCISHAMISAIRPRSFIFSVLVGIAYIIQEKFVLRNLVNLLAGLGFSVSYYEAQHLELSSIYHPQKPTLAKIFCQYVFYNADLNVATLDGLHTFHSFGGIKCFTPAEALPRSYEIQRLTSAPNAVEVGKLGVLELHCTSQKCQKFSNGRVSCIWCVGRLILKKSGYIPVPFINSPPSDDNAFHCTLKAREIIPSSPNDPLLNQVEMILSGFHILMSSLGCIDQTMAASGLKGMLCCAFAPNSVDKMLKHFGRCQFHTRRTTINYEHTPIPGRMDSRKSQLKNHPHLCSEKLNNELSRLKDNGPAAVLCIHVVVFWEGHLSCAQQIISYFHASGNFHNAKCTHICAGHTFSMNRSGTRWSGVWSDMAIEQTLKCNMKSEGGLTRGRGLSDSVLAKWAAGARAAIAICSSLKVFAAVHFMSGEQHIDFRVSRINRDDQNRGNPAQWLAHHPPFAVCDSIMYLSTGVTGNSNINCYRAV
ncbi:hypothetical protein PR048_011259 [Dryococelus australis]|uniref:Uncharacterized protein n=1 Tax=Dryococelus australis TaxID=614101 RepID=A0ABQ9HL43_9NEOP|nr:hypothetical protein PR048_011259 [Dryococelus australis]